MNLLLIFSEAATRGVLWKKLFLEILQKSQENACARVSFFNKNAGLRPAFLLKKRLWHRCFPVNFAKFPRSPFLRNTFGWLLLLFIGFEHTPMFPGGLSDHHNLVVTVLKNTFGNQKSNTRYYRNLWKFDNAVFQTELWEALIRVKRHDLISVLSKPFFFVKSPCSNEN